MLGTLLANRYEILEHLGDGAVASVWRARDRQLGIDVAVKLVHPHLSRDAAARDRVTREALASRRVPGAVTTWETGEDGDHLFLVQEFCPGGDLGARVGPVPEDQVLAWGQRLAATLQAAHDAGVMHRDLKPENVLLDAHGEVRLGDFGLARLADRAGATATSLLAGSVGYAAPEIYDGVTDDPRSDQYALAATLAELATGARLWGDAAPSVVMRRQQQEDAPALPGLSPALASVLRRALSRRPDARFPTMTALAEALAAAGKGEAVAQAPATAACAGCGEPLVPGLAACPHCGKASAVVRRSAEGPYRVEVYGRFPGVGEAFTNWPGRRGSDWLSFQEKAKVVEVAQALTGDTTVPDRQLDRALRRPTVIAADNLDAAGADAIAAELSRAGLQAAVAGPDRQVPWSLRWHTELMRWFPVGMLGLVGAGVLTAAATSSSPEPLAALGPLAIGGAVAGFAAFARRARSVLAPPGTPRAESAPIFESQVATRLTALRDPATRELVADVLRAAAALRAALATGPELARVNGEEAVREAVDAALDLGARLDTLASAPVPRPRRGDSPERIAALDAESSRREVVGVRIRTELLRIAGDLRESATSLASGQAAEAGERARGAADRLRAVVTALEPVAPPDTTEEERTSARRAASRQPGRL